MKKCLELKYFDMRSIKHQIFQFPEAMLIEVQKNLKYFQWDDDFDYGYFTDNDPYEKVFLALEKKLKSQLFARYVENYEHTLLQEVLPKFYNIKILTIDVYLFFNEEKLEKLQMQAYRELEILNIEGNRLNVISSIIENSGANLKKILFEPYNIDYEYDEFNGNSAHFIELEKLLGV
ncbi:22541_t:CDS:2, partial [Rhizophagus irregularis]